MSLIVAIVSLVVFGRPQKVISFIILNLLNLLYYYKFFMKWLSFTLVLGGDKT
jgi:hypothetical protein